MKTQNNKYSAMPHAGFSAMSGEQIGRLMRRSRVTIRMLAKTNGLTMKRVRELRADGVAAGGAAWEIHWLIEEARLTRHFNTQIMNKVKSMQRAA